jgi:GT2 family glycosyltransferase/2-polyprenyl-3-methyl-5-hydroxy-6-metoxy-1,4-benzoquinol methylase
MSELHPDDVQVVIPTRDRWTILKATLDALSQQSVTGFGVTVVVDGMDQKIPDLGTTHVIQKEHGGPGAARNAGVTATQRPIVLFLGDDMIPTSGLVERHLERHNADPSPSTAVLGLSVWHPDVATHRIHRWLDWSATQFDYANIEGDDAGWGRFYSSNVSVKRGFFADAGGFDPDFTYYYEDLDLAWRLHEKGLHLVLEREALAHHLHRIRWPDIVRRFQGIARGEYLMTRKHAWFTPFYRQRVLSAAAKGSVPAFWTRLADSAPGRVRLKARRMANTRYYQQLAPYFLDAWQGERDLEELRAYAGDDYDDGRLRHHMSGVAKELEAVGDEQAFYRTSESYLYDLTAFAMSGTKVPYRADLRRIVPPPARLLDLGCGIGADGLRLIDDGYEVSFADFDNPSTRYLRWRLAERGLTANVYDLDTTDVPGGFDAAFAFDVIEHVDDPFAMLASMEQRASIVMVNLLEEEEDPEHPHHRPLPIAALLDHATRRGLVSYRLYHRRSHLVAYRGNAEPFPASGRLRSMVQRRLGPLIGRSTGRLT